MSQHWWDDPNFTHWGREDWAAAPPGKRPPSPPSLPPLADERTFVAVPANLCPAGFQLHAQRKPSDAERRTAADKVLKKWGIRIW